MTRQANHNLLPQHQSQPYTCPELKRNPGICASRFAAFDLPSRVGHRLFWPDGRITTVTEDKND